MAPSLETRAPELKMALRRRGDMDHVRFGVSQKLIDIRIGVGDIEAFGQLRGHQLFAVTNAHDGSAWNALNLGSVRIRNLPATDYSNLRHASLCFGSFQNGGQAHLKTPRGASN